MNIERPIAFLDLEATGRDPARDRIIELGVVSILPDGQRRTFCQRFNPGVPIHPDATAIHGITDADVAGSPFFSVYAKKIHASLSGKDLGGYNLFRFDLPMLDQEFRRCGLKLDLTGVRVIDCFGIYSKKHQRRLEDAVRQYCGREHDGAHNALADAIATADVFMCQMALYDDLRGMSLQEVADFSRPGDRVYIDLAGKLYRDKDGDACYAFGKYIDRKVREFPDYAMWMMDKDFAGSTVDALVAELARLESNV